MNTVSGFQSALNGITRGVKAFQTNAQIIASQGSTNSPMEAKFTEATIGLKVSENQISASSKVLKAQDEMIGVLLDKLT